MEKANLFNTLLESSLSRIWEKTQNHDWGIITAFHYDVSRDMNLKGNEQIVMRYRKLKYSVTAIDGAWFGDNNKVVNEPSYFISDQHDTGKLHELLIGTGERYEQQSIVLGTVGEPPVIYHIVGGKIEVMHDMDYGSGTEQEAGYSVINGRPFSMKSPAYEYFTRGWSGHMAVGHANYTKPISEIALPTKRHLTKITFNTDEYKEKFLNEHAVDFVDETIQSIYIEDENVLRLLPASCAKYISEIKMPRV